MRVNLMECDLTQRGGSVSLAYRIKPTHVVD